MKNVSLETLDLIERALDGATADELRTLHGALETKSDSAEIDAYLSACSSHHQLRCALTEGASDEAFLRGIETALSDNRKNSGQFILEVSNRAKQALQPHILVTQKPRIQWWKTALFAAAMLALVAGFFFLRNTPPTHPDIGMVVRMAKGAKLIRDGKAVLAPDGHSLQEQDIVRSESGSGTSEVVLNTHATIQLSGKAEASFVTDQPYAIHLSIGRLDIHVGSQPKGHPFVVQTPHANAEVLGTRFALDVSLERTRLEVFESQVRLRTTAQPEGLVVDAGKSAETTKELAITSTPLTLERHSVIFQNGRDGYSSTRDLGITNQNAAFTEGNGSTDRTDTNILICEFDEYQMRAILRFDNLSLPANATLESARLELKFENWNTEISLNAAHLKPAWNPESVGWLIRDKGASWNSPGASDPKLDRAAALAIPAIGSAYEVPVTIQLDPAVVQQWIRDPASNSGVLFWVARHGERTRLFTSRAPEQQRHPALILRYSVPVGTAVPIEHKIETTPLDQF